MPSNWRPLAANLTLAASSLTVTLIVLEWGIFGYMIPPDDLLENVSVNSVVRYKPDTNATFRHPDGTETQVTINKDGWNSTKQSYNLAKTHGRTRIAVVGDSYVHGTFVDVDKGFPHLVEQELQKRGRDAEVYRFGMDGAPLSQYLHVLRNEVLAYGPDVVVVPLIHNDFDESYRFLKTRYTSSFLKLTTNDDGEVLELLPGDFKPGLADRLRRFATFRYLYYETGLYLHAKSLVSRLVWGGDEEYKPEFISSAVDIRKIKDHDKNRFFAHYVMNEMKKLSREHGFKLLFVMDGVREAIYADKPATAYEVGKLNAIAADLTTQLDLPFVDLQTAFSRAYEKTGERFEFSYDWHWNAHANKIVADEIANALVTHPNLQGARKRVSHRAP